MKWFPVCTWTFCNKYKQQNVKDFWGTACTVMTCNMTSANMHYYYLGGKLLTICKFEIKPTGNLINDDKLEEMTGNFMLYLF